MLYSETCLKVLQLIANALLAFYRLYVSVLLTACSFFTSFFCVVFAFPHTS